MSMATNRSGFLISMGAVLALGAGTALANPKVQVDPMEIDLGTIDEGKSFDRFLEVKNIGDGVLVVEEVKTSCGCTAAAVDGTTELKAGESQKVKVTFNSKGQHEGPFSKKVTVTTNDPEKKAVEVSLVGSVHTPVRWNPTFLSVDSVNPKKGFEKTISLLADEGLKLEVKSATVLGGKTMDQPTQLFDVTRGETKVVEGKDQIDFVIKLKPEAKPQKVTEQLLVITNLAGRDSLRVPIRGELVGRLGFSVQFGAIPLAEPGAETVRDLDIIAKDGTFKVLKAEVADSPVKVEIVPAADGMKTTIRLRYVGEEAGTNGIRTLRVETDDADQKFLEIPVRYQTSASGQAAKAAAEGKGGKAKAAKGAEAPKAAGASAGTTTAPKSSAKG